LMRVDEAATDALRRRLALRLVVFGGEALELQSLRGWFERHGDSRPRLVNMYGITETTVHVTYRPVRMADVEAGAGSVIGGPIPDLQLYILDGRMEPVPVGVAGELFVGGSGVARGYLNRPELTAERFLPDPYSEEPGARLYKSGDMARRLEGGDVEYVGRADEQVKVRGFRIELGEIEAAVASHPSVREAVVVAREGGEAGDRRLVAYVVVRGGAESEPGGLRQWARERLPDYMVPSAFVTLDALPLTPNGKVDRRALPEPGQGGGGAGAAEQDYVAPRSATEEVVAGIFAEVLGLNRVGAHDDFFELGGHSLLATQVVSRVREVLRAEVALRSLFESSTVADFAAAVEAALGGGEQAAGLPPIVRVTREGALPLSFAQQRLWLLNRMNPESPAYNIPAAVRLKGRLDVGALERTFREIVRRHEILRTTYETRGDRPVQVIHPPLELKLPMLSLRALPEGGREETARGFALEETQSPFKLSEEIPLRVGLIELSKDDYLLLVTLHHIAADGWSMGILIGEIEALYRAFSSEEPSPLAELPVQYADFAAWQRNYLAGEVMEGHLAYWRERLEGAPARLELPTDRPRPSARTLRGATRTATLPAELSEAVRSASERGGVTPFMLLLAALKALLYRWTGQEEIVVGTVVANRNQLEVERLIGCFMNFLALRTKVSGALTARGLLSEVKETVLGAYAHQDYPFEKLVEELKPDRANNPFYNVAFLLQNYPRTPVLSDTLEAGLMPLDNRTALLDLRLVAEESPEGLRLWCEYNSDIFEEETISGFVESYRAVLEQFVAEPDAPVERLSLPEAFEAAARGPQPVITVTSSFTAEPVEKTLAFWTRQLEMPHRVEFAPYNQVFQQLLDPNSLLSRNRAGVNVVLVRFEDWQRFGESGGEGEPADPARLSAEQVERDVRDLTEALRGAGERAAAPLLVCVCPPSPAALAPRGRADFFRRMEELLQAGLEEANGVYLVTSAELAEIYPVADYYDAHADRLGHVPYVPAFFTALGTMIARKAHALKGNPYKVIVLDCDDTLWDGVVGEDGALGVRLGEPHRRLQQFMVAQHDAGMLICLCSKNSEEDVLEVLERHAEMPLRREHLAAWRINWRPKSENVLALAEQLGLGLDSFIVIDNNPVECAEIRARCPGALVLQLPEKHEDFPRFLRHTWAFDRLKVTAEDRRRTALYRTNAERERARRESMTFADFLAALDLKTQIGEVTPEQFERVAQLTQRTNQFNLTTVRRTAAEARALCRAGGKGCLAVEVSDRFGDYGLVGVLIYEPAAGALEVDTFLLSCRVLGRGVEHRMLARLGELARERELTRVNLYYVPTQRNRPALDFLESLGAGHEPLGEGRRLYSLPAEFAAAVKYDPDAGGPGRPDGTDERDGLAKAQTGGGE
ncbi:MAG: HAD-IIIC family phosphatase, partial [Acidobacteriota bacterium]|nr:HAD-IIIC family phosphatase [Acidobacteriota bacterium]